MGVNTSLLSKMSGLKRLVSVVNLHRMGYLAADNVQNRFAQTHLDHLAGRPGSPAKNVLLLVEHDPVYTIGIRDVYNKDEEMKLKSLGAEFFRTNRGGLITFHGPGQLVAYPVINLKQFNMGMKEYVESLEKLMIGTCNQFGLEARTTDNTGVWIGDKKVGAIGVHGKRFITTHGVSVNCNNDLSWFKHIVPCGLEGKEVTSLSQELQREVSIKDCIPELLESFQNTFDCELEELFLEEEDFDLMPNHREDGHKGTEEEQIAAKT